MHRVRRPLKFALLSCVYLRLLTTPFRLQFFSHFAERERGTCRVGSKCVGVIIASVNIFGPLTCPLMRSSCRCGMWVDVITVSVAVKCCQVYHSRPHAYRYIYEYLHFILQPCWEIYWLWKWAPLMNYEYFRILSYSKIYKYTQYGK